MFAAPGSASAAATIRHYSIDVEIAPAAGELRATADVTIGAPNEATDAVDLLLNRGMVLKTVECPAGVKSLRFDPTQPSTSRYSPTAAPLRVELARPLKPGESTVLRLSYAGVLEPDTWRTSLITRDWVELAFYGSWYPLDAGPPSPSRGFTSEVRVKTDGGYGVTGSGVTRAGAGGTTTLTQPEPTFDIVVIAAPHLHQRQMGDARLGIDLWRTAVSDEQADRIGADIGRIAAELERLLGGPAPLRAGTRLTVVFAQRTSGGSYFRPGFLSLVLGDDYRGIIRDAAHEVAHFWWHRGSVATWEDWLNESFAEYSALLLMQSWYGPEVFADYLARYQKEAEKAPAIWGLDRSDPAAFLALYRKGPVLLHGLDERIGHETFQKLLATLVARDVRTTADFSATLTALTSKDVAAAFEESLRQARPRAQ
jgi:hypothetical protein